MRRACAILLCLLAAPDAPTTGVQAAIAEESGAPSDSSQAVRAPKLTPGHWLPLQMLSRGTLDPAREGAIAGTLLGITALYQSTPGLAAPLGVIVAPRLWSGVAGETPRASEPARGEVELTLNSFYVPCGCPEEVFWHMPTSEVRIFVNSITAAASEGVPRIRQVSPNVFVNETRPEVQAILTKRDEPLFVSEGGSSRWIPNPNFFDPRLPMSEAQLLVVYNPTQLDSLPSSVRAAFQEIELDRLLDLLPD
ncbi:MAG: hypothetical protein U0527_16690 [Candidatus Eisenbacteria bacterium]